MASDDSSEQLLRRIADATGLDVDTFFAARRGTRARVGEARHGPQLLHRLVKAFRSLPSDEDRLQAVELLERLATRDERRLDAIEAKQTDAELLN